MKKILYVSILLALAQFVGCAGTGFNSKTGVASLYTDLREPVSNSAATTGSKRGEACASNILGIIATGDASIIAARANGGITKVATVDAYYSNILFLIGKYCTIVTGE